MKLEKLVGDRFKERPSECLVDSHALMLRGGYMKYVSSGIFSQYMPLRRICRKIEQIIREEMDKIDGQEVLMPVMMPSSIWEQSGRYSSIGAEMFRFKDRNDANMVLGMTHEEAAVHLVREYANTYNKYPFMIYQIQTKERDEARPRGGLIRVREFTMKDAYSFHTSQQDLEQYYDRCHKAYERIYARAGVPEVISVKSDSGIMGGSVSHEFMLVTPIGEDSIVICPECGYKSNMEAADSITEPADYGDAALEKIATGDAHTIDEVCALTKTDPKQSCKAVIYQRNADDSYVVIFLRGDLDVNETKLTNLLGCDVHPATVTENSGIAAGCTGPYDFKAKATVLYDLSLKGARNIVCGANEDGYHYKGLDFARDIPDAEFHDLSKAITGGICPVCGKHALTISRGVEVGNIFMLGTKYTKSMGMQYTDENGKLQYPVMGCYGIGVGRLAASVCEAHHDEFGPIWPKSIAPWQVHLCCLRADDADTHAYADALYKKLEDAGVEVIYDDRNVSAGIMFSDADLLGIPLRVIVSPRNMKEGAVELAARDKSFRDKIPTDQAFDEIIKRVRE